MLLRKLFLSGIVFYVLVFGFAVSVEASSPTWSQTYGGTRGDWATSVIATSDGGYALAGYVVSPDMGGTNFWLVKTNSTGHMTWNKTYDSSNNEWAYSLIETSDGGFALLGATNMSVDECPAAFWLIKTDEFGNVEWNKTYDGGVQAGNGGLFLSDRSLIETGDGGYAISGYTNSSGAGCDDFLLIKTNATGYMEWQQTYGGSGNDRAYSLVEASDGGYVLGGETNASEAVSGSGDFWLVKTDEFGAMEWNQTYCRAEESGFLIPAFSLVNASDGGYVLAGSTGESGSADVYLAKIDSFGAMEWNRTFGGPDIDWANSLVVTSDGGYAIAGNTDCSGAGQMDFWLIKTDASGNLEWKQICGGIDDDRAFSVAEAHDGGYVVAGFTESFSDDRDFWLVKTDGCMPVSELVTYEFDFSYGYGEYVVVVSTNSTVGGFDFGIEQDRVSFTVTGPTGTTGFAEIVIPEDLTDGEFPVYLNELMLLEGAEYTKTYNGTHTIIEMTYSHSTHMIEITGTNVIPEYSSWILPTLLLAATVFIVVNKKKLFNTC